MTAGASAAAEARRLEATAEAHVRAAEIARETAVRYRLAATTEKRTAALLAPLSAAGYHLLADRCWPGSRRSQVDLVVVGPGGVFVVDTKAWARFSVVEGRAYRDQEDVTEELETLTSLVEVTQSHLATTLGLAPGEVHAVAVMAGQSNLAAQVGGVAVVGEHDVLRHLASYGTRLTPTEVDGLLNECLSFFPVTREPAPVVAAVVPPVVAYETEQDELISAEAVLAALEQAVLAAPIEDWMTFLHPTQARTVCRSFNGPSRLRGPAGCGKTVVGLHRAAWLARSRPGTVLVTSFVRTLPDVLGGLLERLAPDVVDRVEFTGIHAWAKGLLKDRGIPHRLRPDDADAAFDAAFRVAGAPLRALNPDVRYWRDEIQSVIKGRGITSFEVYVDLNRTGRRRRLGLPERRLVWDLHLAYAAELRRRDINDFGDLILLAEQELEREPLPGYAAVIVDEAQDMSCAMVRLLHRLVGDGEDALTLIGDGQQTIYPGGWSLSEAGVSIAGRGVVFDVNYRNTQEIHEFASRLVADDEYADLEGAVARGEVPSSVPRRGAQPLFLTATNDAEQRRMLVTAAQHATRAPGTGAGDVGVLCLTTGAVKWAIRVLEGAGLPTTPLETYDGRHASGILVGTVKRAKGLEFKQVVMPDLPSRALGTPPEEDAARERWDLLRREAYVGMTRARDGLRICFRA